MKVKPEHLQHMRDAINAFVEQYGADKLAAHKLALASHPRVKDVETRYRWDLFTAAGLTRYACDVLYTYCTDTHIDTALRSIVR